VPRVAAHAFRRDVLLWPVLVGRVEARVVSEQSQGEGWWQAADGKWYPPQTPAPTTNTMAVAALVCGLASLTLTPLFVLQVLAVVFGHKALRQIRQDPTSERGRGMALAGLVVGYVAIVVGVLFWVMFLIEGPDASAVGWPR
jgi:hypothetical protein